jgi:hypothetical protein
MRCLISSSLNGPPRKRRKHRLAVYAEQNQRHEIGVVFANGALPLAEHQQVSDKPLERGAIRRRLQGLALDGGKGQPGKRGMKKC